MYPTHAVRSRVRAPRAPYGSGGADAHASSGPASGCLLDLETADPADALRIVARFCVLRWLVLRQTGSPPELLRHAHDAARSHLAGVGPAWPEGEQLVRLVEQPEPLAPTLARLRAVARRARAAGHAHGAREARRTAVLLVLGSDAGPWPN